MFRSLPPTTAMLAGVDRGSPQIQIPSVVGHPRASRAHQHPRVGGYGHHPITLRKRRPLHVVTLPSAHPPNSLRR